jgi:hypothetical protein
VERKKREREAGGRNEKKDSGDSNGRGEGGR